MKVKLKKIVINTEVDNTLFKPVYIKPISYWLSLWSPSRHIKPYKEIAFTLKGKNTLLIPLSHHCGIMYVDGYTQPIYIKYFYMTYEEYLSCKTSIRVNSISKNWVFNTNEFLPTVSIKVERLGLFDTREISLVNKLRILQDSVLLCSSENATEGLSLHWLKFYRIKFENYE